jgi:hypothetical protein
MAVKQILDELMDAATKRIEETKELLQFIK